MRDNLEPFRDFVEQLSGTIYRLEKVREFIEHDGFTAVEVVIEWSPYHNFDGEHVIDSMTQINGSVFEVEMSEIGKYRNLFKRYQADIERLEAIMEREKIGVGIPIPKKGPPREIF